jgi:hypothetical protein
MSQESIARLLAESFGGEGFVWGRELTETEHLAVMQWHIQQGTFGTRAEGFRARKSWPETPTGEHQLF